MNASFVGLLTTSTKLFTETIEADDHSQVIVLIFLSIMVTSLLTIVYNLNLTMQNYSQLYVMPFYESCAIIFNLISGLLLLNEYELYTASQLSKILFGCLISTSGILLKLTTREAFEAKDDQVSNQETDDSYYSHTMSMMDEEEESDLDKLGVMGVIGENNENCDEELQNQSLLVLNTSINEQMLTFEDIVFYLKNH